MTKKAVKKVAKNKRCSEANDKMSPGNGHRYHWSIKAVDAPGKRAVYVVPLDAALAALSTGAHGHKQRKKMLRGRMRLPVIGVRCEGLTGGREAVWRLDLLGDSVRRE